MIGEEKILIYIDDILIATETVEQNLLILKDVLFLLKKYNLDLTWRSVPFYEAKSII